MVGPERPARILDFGFDCGEFGSRRLHVLRDLRALLLKLDQPRIFRTERLARDLDLGVDLGELLSGGKIGRASRAAFLTAARRQCLPRRERGQRSPLQRRPCRLRRQNNAA